MKTNKHFGIFASLAIAWLAIASRAHAGPEYTPNMVVETSAPGLARLEVLLSSKEWNEPRRFIFEGKGSIAGGISLPEKYAADYSITAYDEDGKPINTGKGPIPPVATLDKPLSIPLPPLEKGEGLVVSVNRERIALDVQPYKESPGEIAIHADVFDAAGNPAKIDPEQLYWQLSDGRYLDLRRDYDPRDIKVVPHKGFEFQRLCALEPVVTLCRPNTQCRAIKVCTDPWVKISAGATHTCALKESGAAFCWGVNNDGQLGAPTTSTCGMGSTAASCSTRPLPVVCPAGAPCRFTQISAGGTLTVAVDVNGDVWWWGRGLPTHHRVDAFLAGSRVTFSQAAAGFGHGCAISISRSEVWCWGTNGYGETGATGFQSGGPIEIPDYAPIRVMVPLKFRKVVAGGEHTCAIGSGSTDVVCWGRDDLNQSSGPNSTVLVNPGTTKFFFQKFGGLTAINDVSTSISSTCVTLGSGNGVKCWGEHSWRNVASFNSLDLLTVGFKQICGLIGQQAQCLGTNAWGELGIGSLMSQGTAVNVNAPPALFSDLAAGSNHTCGITPDGNAFCWGGNLFGQVGNGATSYGERSPKQVTTP